MTIEMLVSDSCPKLRDPQNSLAFLCDPDDVGQRPEVLVVVGVHKPRFVAAHTLDEMAVVGEEERRLWSTFQMLRSDKIDRQFEQNVVEVIHRVR